jgi:asparagine synthase (glutamine-hydrolysing)
VVVCQTRLDNRAELLAAFDISIADAREIADATLLRRAYDRWGESMMGKVCGDVAFAAWHRRTNRVVAAVDPYGAAHLFWARGTSGLILSGQMPALLAHPDVPRAPDFAALATIFTGGVDRRSTPYEAVRALPGGHVLVWDGRDVEVTRWWNPASVTEVRYRDPLDYVASARESFDRAVADRLRGIGSMSATLSGGLDSGLVAATAAGQLRASGRGLTAYTAVPTPEIPATVRPGWDVDDGPYASAVAAMHPNVRHVLVNTGTRCSLDVIPEIHASEYGPTRNVSNIVWFDAIAADLRESGSRVLLVGNAGNGTISWVGSGALAELLAAKRWWPALQHAGAMARAEPADFLRRLRGRLAPWQRPAVPASNGPAFLNPGPWRAAANSNGRGDGLGPRERWTRFATTAFHTWWPDPLSQHGVEYRDPTADRRLVERLLSFPQHAFQTDGRERGLARSLASGRLPDSVRLRRTRGAQMPDLSGRTAVHAGRYRDALAIMARSPACRAFFDMAAIDRALARHPDATLDGYDSALAIDRACDVGLFLCRLDGIQ